MKQNKTSHIVNGQLKSWIIILKLSKRRNIFMRFLQSWSSAETHFYYDRKTVIIISSLVINGLHICLNKIKHRNKNGTLWRNIFIYVWLFILKKYISLLDRLCWSDDKRALNDVGLNLIVSTKSAQNFNRDLPVQLFRPYLVCDEILGKTFQIHYPVVFITKKIYAMNERKLVFELCSVYIPFGFYYLDYFSFGNHFCLQ